jgi:hypothetical protein
LCERARGDFNIASCYLRYSLLEDLLLDVFSSEKDIIKTYGKLYNLIPYEEVLFEKEISYIMNTRKMCFRWLKGNCVAKNVRPQLIAAVGKEFPILAKVSFGTKSLRKIQRTLYLSSMEFKYAMYFRTQNVCLIDPFKLFKGDKLISIDEINDYNIEVPKLISRTISVSPPPGSSFGFRTKRKVDKTALEWQIYDSKRQRTEDSYFARMRPATERFSGGNLFLRDEESGEVHILYGIHPR